MNTSSFFTSACQLIDTAASGAHAAIGAYRKGGEQLAQYADQRWNESFRAARPRLTPETRRNAARARRVLGGYYTRGLALSARGAAAAVDALAAGAGTLVERAVPAGGRTGRAG